MKAHHIFLTTLLCFIFGIAVASFVAIPKAVFWFIAIVAAAWTILYIFKKSPKSAVGIFILVCLIGVWRYQIKADISNISFPQGKTHASFSGIVSEYPDERIDKTYLVLSDIKFIDAQINIDQEIRMRITISRHPRYEYGDVLFLEGTVMRPENFDDFDYKSYLAKDDIYLVSSYPKIALVAKEKGNFLKQELFSIRKNFSHALRSSLYEPDASLAEGLLLGVSSKIPQSVKDNFKAAGLTHIIALSGFNITIIAQFLIFLFSAMSLKREWSFWLAIGGISCFVVLTGAEASVVRAAVMGILILVAQREGRIYSIQNAIVFAAAVMIWHNPKVLRFDIGFQLSFLATLGIVYIKPRLEILLEKIPEFFSLKEYFIATLSAQFAVLPILLYQFEQLSLIAPFANLAVLPFIPFAMLMSFVASIGYFLVPIARDIISSPAHLILKYMIWAAEFFAKMPFASVHFGMSVIFVLLYSAVLFLLVKLKSSRE